MQKLFKLFYQQELEKVEEKREVFEPREITKAKDRTKFMTNIVDYKLSLQKNNLQKRISKQQELISNKIKA